MRVHVYRCGNMREEAYIYRLEVGTKEEIFLGLNIGELIDWHMHEFIGLPKNNQLESSKGNKRYITIIIH